MLLIRRVMNDNSDEGNGIDGRKYRRDSEKIWNLGPLQYQCSGR